REIIPELQREDKARGLSLDLENAFLRKEKGSYSYHLQAHLLSRYYEISQLSLSVKLLDNQDISQYQQTLTLLDEDQATLYPGDALPISIIFRSEQINASIRQVVITVEEINRVLPEEADDQPLPTAWETDTPPGVAVELSERSQFIEAGPDVFSHQLVLTFSNRGAQPIHRLRAEIQWFDRSDQLIHNEEIDLVSANEPPLKPGLRRTFLARFLINHRLEDYAAYRVVLTQVD
ncbi:MAG: hypothetical protein HC880_16695, partial [Bacteroidia bacterium]|nr:hypothetical protein [Bacteroidia bacterium]